MKGFTWYGSSILYVILGTISISSNPTSFDFETQIIIAVICIGLAITGHLLIDKKVSIPYSEESESDKAEKDVCDAIKYCRKCGENLEENSRFCRKCGTEVVEIPQ